MQIFGIELSKLRYSSFFEQITNLKEKNIIFTPNPEILLIAKKNEEFKNMLNMANFLVPDGIGIYAGFQILENGLGKITSTLLVPYYGLNLFFARQKLYEKYGDRICGSDLTKDLLGFADKNKLGVTIIDLYFVPKNTGDYQKLEAIKNTIPELNKIYPNIIFHQYIYKENEKDTIIKKINETNDVILLSTLGAYKQEKSIIDLMSDLSNIKIACGIGGSLDFLIGFKKRAPAIFSKLGLEWLWRLFLQPKRMIKRIWNAIFVFLYEVINSK